MKLQFLGDVRDAFKWDLLHWLCTRSEPPFAHLLYVPMLTPDDPHSRDGQISHHRFPCRTEISKFVTSLAEAPRTLSRVKTLGEVCSEPRFSVEVYKADEHIGTGTKRNGYWADLPRFLRPNSLVFFDPDNGFETEKQVGPKWVRHCEVCDLVSRLHPDSAAVVYQHRPHKKWDAVFASLAGHTRYAENVVAIREGNLALVAMSNDITTGVRLIAALRSYATAHAKGKVAFADLKQAGACWEPGGRITTREFSMDQLTNEAKLKELVKAAVVEVFEERSDLVRDAMAEAVEDLGMFRAIQEGSRSRPISRNHVFRILRKRR